MKVSVERMVVAVLAAIYVSVWAASLLVALQSHPDELLAPTGHGTLEASFMALGGITRPLGMLAQAVLDPAPRGRAGIVNLWCVAGVLGAIQWAAVGGIATLIWQQFRPQKTTLSLK